jgi:hypothetical protein
MLDKDCFLYGHDYYAAYITKYSPVISTSQCQADCLMLIGCDIFEHSTVENICFLKSWDNVAQSSYASDVITGPPTCTPYQGMQISNHY